MQQRVLDLSLRDDATFENYFTGQNGQALSCLQNIIKGKEQYAYLYGSGGVGKTHLLQAACAAASAARQTSLYLPLSESSELSPYMLEGLEQVQLVCIDDIESIAGHREWEESLMVLYNRIKAERHALIIAGSGLPNNMGLKLGDLSSRLGWGLVFQLHALTDQEKLEVLQNSAKNRGMNLPDNSGRFLLTHGPRNLADLFMILRKLEQASLIAKRTLTLPFIKDVLEMK